MASLITIYTSLSGNLPLVQWGQDDTLTVTTQESETLVVWYFIHLWVDMSWTYVNKNWRKTSKLTANKPYPTNSQTLWFWWRIASTDGERSRGNNLLHSPLLLFVELCPTFFLRQIYYRAIHGELFPSGYIVLLFLPASKPADGIVDVKQPSLLNAQVGCVGINFCWLCHTQPIGPKLGFSGEYGPRY